MDFSPFMDLPMESPLSICNQYFNAIL